MRRVRPLLAVAVWMVVAACDRFGEGERVEIHDHLLAPAAITHVEADAIEVADGRRAELAGIGELVAVCPSLRTGVDVSPDGTVWGLVPIFHWCGNDPVGQHEERIPLAPLIRFLRESPEARPLADAFDRVGRLDVRAFRGFAAWAGVPDPHALEIRFPGE